MKIDIKNLIPLNEIDYEKYDIGIPLKNDNDLKQFMKEIWCIEIHIQNINMPIVVTGKTHNVIIEHMILVYEEDNEYKVTL